jgi:hypothetical protein
MFNKVIKMACLLGALTLVACGAATPQFIGSSPQTGQTYNSPPLINNDGPAQPHLQIDYNAALEIEVANPNWAIASVRAVAENYGGYLITSESWRDNGNDYASVTIAVPVSNFEAARARLKSLGEVRSESVSGQIHDQGPTYLNELQTYSNITVTLTPQSANWGKRLGSFLGGLATVLFWIVVIVTPIALMLVGLATCVNALANWIDRRGKPKA